MCSGLDIDSRVLSAYRPRELKTRVYMAVLAALTTIASLPEPGESFGWPVGNGGESHPAHYRADTPFAWG